VIAKNVDRPRSSVSRRLNTLEAGNIVEKFERGHYKLTEEGYAKMLEKVSMEELGEDLPDSQSWYTTKILTPNELKKRDENTD
jgi:Mn-dependent DtxR family transcriptional regulator